MNNQNVVRVKATTDGKYKRMYQDHIERDEFEYFNKRTAERVSKMRKALWEQEAKAALEQVKHEKKFNGILNLVTVILFCIVATAALCALSCTDNLDWAITAIFVALLSLCGAFRAGYIWRDIKF